MTRPKPADQTQLGGSFNQALFDKGLATRREVLGREHVDASLAKAAEDPLRMELQQLVTQHCWGDIWNRPGLDRRTRSFLNLAMITALNRPHELRLHVRGAINNGLTKEEINEVFMQAAIYCGSCYYVPDRTLVGNWRSGALGIRAASHLFGGIVPHGFIATKVVSHGLWAADSQAPAGWAHGLAPRLHGCVLSGYSAFSREDALRAGRALLRNGPVRLKSAAACAGRGQRVVEDNGDLEAAVDDAARSGALASGIVLEENLEDVETFSVGWCRVGDHTLAYVGTQELTRDRQGQPVYGGSVLRCVRGEPGRLASLDLSAGLARAVELAVAYDAAVSAAYPGLHASRRNYDVAAGRDAGGRTRTGVLEQSWRMGGASPAEMAAMVHFFRTPLQDEVWAYSKERYGADAGEPPAGDCVFQGEDSQVGFMTKSGGILDTRGSEYGGS